MTGKPGPGTFSAVISAQFIATMQIYFQNWTWSVWVWFGLETRIFYTLQPCPLWSLLARKSTELKSLTLIGLSLACLDRLSAKENINFPQLETLDLSLFEWFKSSGGTEKRERQKELLQRFLHGAPTLQRIIHEGDIRILELLPEEVQLIHKTDITVMISDSICYFLKSSTERFTFELKATFGFYA